MGKNIPYISSLLTHESVKYRQRNIHFYVNRYGFHIVEFSNSHHHDPNAPDGAEQNDDQFPDGMFRFEKVLR